MVRLKHRYIICQVVLDEMATASIQSNSARSLPFANRDVLSSLREKVQVLFGDFGSATIASALAIKYYDAAIGQIFVIRCPRDVETSVHTAISCLISVKNHSLVVRTLDTCGSERCCVERLREITKLAFDQTKFSSSSEKEDAWKDLIKKIDAIESSTKL